MCAVFSWPCVALWPTHSLHSPMWCVLERRTSQRIMLSRLRWQQMIVWVWVYVFCLKQCDCKIIFPSAPKLHPITTFMPSSPPCQKQTESNYQQLRFWHATFRRLGPQWNERRELSMFTFQWHKPFTKTSSGPLHKGSTGSSLIHLEEEDDCVLKSYSSKYGPDNGGSFRRHSSVVVNLKSVPGGILLGTKEE